MKLHYKYVKAFTIGLQSSMEYRSDFFIGMISALYPIIIQVFMWSNIYGGSNSNIMFGYTYVQMITYSIIASIVSKLVRTGFEYEICDEIKNGGLNKYIVKPIGYFPYKLACFLGQKVVQLGFTLLLLFIVLLALGNYFSFFFELHRIMYFIIALFLAFVMNFIIFFCVSMVAFWLSEIGFFFEAVRIVIIAFSGGIFPLDVLGDGFLSILNYMPFRYTVNFPVDILNGKAAVNEICLGLLLQLAWVFILFFISRILLMVGSKKYDAVGG